MIGARQAVVDALGWVAGVELLSPWRRLPISPTRTTAGEEMVAAWWSLDDETDPQLRIRADVIGKVLGWTLQARDEPPVAWPRAS